MFGFPLHLVGTVRLGALLTSTADRPGPLSDDQHADALVLADIAAQAILIDASPRVRPTQLGRRTRMGGRTSTLVVHQATGDDRPPNSTSASPRP